MIKAPTNSRYSWLAALTWALFTLVLCGWPGDQLPEINFWKWLRWDKITHLILFGVQSLLLLIAVKNSDPNKSVAPKIGWILVLITMGYGVIVEVLQYYVFIGRSGDLKDAIANGIGALLGLWIFRKKPTSPFNTTS